MLRAVKSAGLRPKTGLKPSGNGFLLCMVSTAESRHYNELNPIFKVNPHVPSTHHQA
ncbi:hypothetical protein ISS30_08925 [bacterium]|nr:hypothetical protein [bacterium]